MDKWRKTISTFLADYGLTLGLGGAASIFVLGDSVVSDFSRSQLDELLEKRNSGSLTKFFCQSFIEKSDEMSLCCSLLEAGFVAAYFAYGVIRWHEVPLLELLLWLVVPFLALVLLSKVVSRAFPEKALLYLSALLWVCSLPIRPLASAVVWVEEKFYSFFSDSDSPDEEDRIDIIAAVTDGQHEGVVKDEEREMIVNIFDLKNFDISDIMTPRTDICAVDITALISDAIAMSVEHGYSRIPVYSENRDNIKGIFYVKDALRLWGHPEDKMPPLEQIMREPLFVPETKEVAELMGEIQDRKIHMAVVLDEYGGTAGIVTIEDIVEEIVGEIQDEYDPEEAVLLRELEGGAFEAHARTHVHDMNEALQDKVIPETDDFETIGGFILDQLGHVPVPKEELVWEGWRFRILSADERKIGRIRIEPLPEKEREQSVAG